MNKRLLLVLMVLCAISNCALADAPIVRAGDPEQSRIAITVDDCYNAETVAAFLDLCEEYDVPVTFFVIGKALKFKDSEVWQRAVSLGCEIGNHTWEHCFLTKKSAQNIKYQMLRTQQKVDELLGVHYPMQVMRPPMGRTNKALPGAVSDVGYQLVVKWDVASTDPAQCLKKTQNGSILLFHANKKDLNCLTEILPELLAQGFEPVTVSRLFSLPDIEPTDQLYTYDRKDTL